MHCRALRTVSGSRSSPSPRPERQSPQSRRAASRRVWAWASASEGLGLTALDAFQLVLVVLEGGGRLDALLTGGVGFAAGFQHLTDSLQQRGQVAGFVQAVLHGPEGPQRAFILGKVGTLPFQFGLRVLHGVPGGAGRLGAGQRSFRRFPARAR